MIPHNPKEAATLLDTVHPNWFKKIDLAKLDNRDNYNCILGQLYGAYWDGLETLFPVEDEKEKVAVYVPLFFDVFCGNKQKKWEEEINLRIMQ